MNDDFSKEELARFEARLREREEEVRERLKQNHAATQPVAPDSSLGRLTRQDALQQRQMALHTERQLERQLEQIRAAQHRLEKGLFGECPRCGDLIDTKRLDAVPEAPFCMDCVS